MSDNDNPAAAAAPAQDEPLPDAFLAQPVAAGPTPAGAAGRDYAAIVEAWFHASFANSPVSRSTEQWNIALAAKDKLVFLLTQGA